MSIITLLTDFGSEDEYVGVMKGVILSVNPTAAIVDITHHIDPQGVIQAAYVVEAAWKYFPEGTVHVVIIDPGVGSDRDIVTCKQSGHLFVAPDNGVMTLLMEKGGIDAAVRVENTRYFLSTVSRTFHGRDIFAPVSAHLTLGVAINELGPPVDPKHLVRLSIQKPTIPKQGEILGAIVTIDRFGNLITNIHGDLVRTHCADAAETLEIQIGKSKIIGISNSYICVTAGDPLVTTGSRGCLEIAVNSGNAARRFNARKGDIVRVTVPGR